MDACVQALPEIPIERIMHVNFANTDELNEHHRKWYIDTTPEEYRRLMGKLMEFEDEIAPVAKDIKEYIDNTYTKDLKKKGTLSSFVTELAAAGGRAAKRLSGEGGAAFP
jgi:alpha-L-fucosidase